MNSSPAPSERTPDAHFLIGRTLACLMLSVWFSMALIAQNPPGAESSAAGSTMRVTHVLGLEGISNNATGNLSIQQNALQFQKGEGPAVQVSIDSIQNIFLAEDDKQVGGTSMAVARTAAPFGGGRVVGLFSHKKYDTLTLEYLDTNGGFHGAIFQLDKGQGQVLRDELVAKGAHVTQAEDQPAKQSTPEAENESK